MPSIDADEHPLWLTAGSWPDAAYGGDVRRDGRHADFEVEASGSIRQWCVNHGQSQRSPGGYGGRQLADPGPITFLISLRGTMRR